MRPLFFAHNLLPPVLLEATEANFFLRVYEMDCPHRELREAVGTSQRAFQGLGIGYAHVSITDHPSGFSRDVHAVAGHPWHSRASAHHSRRSDRSSATGCGEYRVFHDCALRDFHPAPSESADAANFAHRGDGSRSDATSGHQPQRSLRQISDERKKAGVSCVIAHLFTSRFLQPVPPFEDLPLD
jgi:hypothetical protein